DVPRCQDAGAPVASQPDVETKEVDTTPLRPEVTDLHRVGTQVTFVPAPHGIELHTGAWLPALARPGVAIRDEVGLGIVHRIGGYRRRKTRRVDVAVVGPGEPPGEVGPYIKIENLHEVPGRCRAPSQLDVAADFSGWRRTAGHRERGGAGPAR